MTALTSDPMRVAVLDTQVALGMKVEFYDPDGNRYGLPTYPYRWAPTHLATRRQLRSQQLCPGGQDIAAQILWRHKGRRRVAYLYDIQHAKTKRIATPAQLAAVGKALLARRFCTSCQQHKPYYIPRRYGECLDCIPDGA
ncbi:RRQRL motif-containing zinc-binding protein [Dactylosporangium sp. McL0621]|uniref:RRQRL motif-containing zinc-binding protein n=1 Tax=Dactylosporangium sp. McL0621 TaxID=3415678 RepID=UPI003CE89A3C